MSNDSNDQNSSGEGSSTGHPDESEFALESVERSEALLTDVRTVRPQAPRRRPPTSAARLTSDPSSAQLNPELGIGNNSSEDESVVELKPRTWEKPKVRWIDELKAVQAKKAASVGFGEVSRSVGQESGSLSSPSVMVSGTGRDEEQEGFLAASRSFESPTDVVVISMNEVRMTAEYRIIKCKCAVHLSLVQDA